MTTTLSEATNLLTPSNISTASWDYSYNGNCLFNFLKDGYCDPNLASIPVYLDLGSALAAFGLIFAVYQLRRPKWDVILRIRATWQSKLFWILGGAGLLLTLLRILIVEVPLGYLDYPYGVPLFYEILAYLFFLASPISLIYFASRPWRLFSKKTARKFYEVMVQEISKSNDESINSALEVLLANFDEICKSASANDPESEVQHSARAILDVVLSDDSIVRVLTTKRLDALQYIFALVEKHNLNRRHSGAGVPKIVQSLLYEKESFLYKQLEETGLALSSNLYESIFQSPTLLSNFDLFGYPTSDYVRRQKIDASGISVYIKALSAAIHTYYKTGKVRARHINNGLSDLSAIFGDLCSKISTEENRGIDTKYAMSAEWAGLHDIAYFFGHDYLFLGHDEQLNQTIVKNEKTAIDASFHSSETISGGVAAAIYKGLVQLSYIKKTTDVYYPVLDLIHGMIFEDSALKEGYKVPFEKIIWQNIGSNIVHHHYPAVLRSYLCNIGHFLVSEDKGGDSWINNQTERMRRLLYVDLKPLLENKEKMADGTDMAEALLPDSIKYSGGKFTYTTGFGKGSEIQIPEPPSGSRSALENVELTKFMHLI